MKVAKSIAMMCSPGEGLCSLFLLYKYNIIKRKGQGFYCQVNVKGFVSGWVKSRINDPFSSVGIYPSLDYLYNIPWDAEDCKRFLVK